MARQIIDTGTLELNGQDGDTNRDASDKINANFQELYGANENFVRGAGVVPGGALVVFAGTTGNQVAAASGGAPGTAAFASTTDFATAAQGAKADNAQAQLSAGDNITIDNTDPLNPIISASGGGGGSVSTVAGVEPFGGDIPASSLATALGVDNKLDSTATAAAATKLATARNINGVAFDGTASITVADPTKEPVISAGTASQYWNGLKAWIDFAASVRASVLTGLSLATSTAVAAADSVLVAIGKLQAQVSLKLDATGTAADSAKLNGQSASFYTAEMGAASASVAGTKGLAPAPAAGDQVKFLRGDKTWAAVTASAAWGAITGTLSAQSDLQAALDAQALRSTNLEFSYTSADTSFTNGAVTTLTHGLGAEPRKVNVEVIVVTAQHGYAVGTVIDLGSGGAQYIASGAYGFTISKNTTQISLTVASGGIVIISSGAAQAFTTANIRLRVRASLK